MMRKNVLGLLLTVVVGVSVSNGCSSDDDPSNAGGSGGSAGSSGSGGSAGKTAGSGGSSTAGSSGGSGGSSTAGSSAGSTAGAFGFAGNSAGSGGSTEIKDAGVMDAPPPYMGPLFDFENNATTGWSDARAGKASFSIDSTHFKGGTKSLRIDINYDTAMHTSQTEWFPGWGGGAVNRSKLGVPCWVERPLTAWMRVSANWPRDIFGAVFHDNAFAWESANVFVPNAKETWFKVNFKKLDPALMPIRDNDMGFLHVGFYLNGIVNPNPPPDGGVGDAGADAGAGTKITYSLWIDDVTCE